MGNTNIQFKSANGGVYIFEHVEKVWYCFAPTRVLPEDVLEQIAELKEKADMLKDIKGGAI